MEADEEHRRPLTGGSRTPPGDKNNGVAVNARSADGTATPEPMSLGLATPGRGPALDAQLIPDPGKAAPPALPPRPRVPPRPASMVAPARGRSGTGGCGLCWRGGGGLRKYVFLCAACGSLSSLLGILFLAVYFLLRSYTSSLVYFETVPTYVPASMLLSTGLVVMCLARRRNRYSFLMKLCGCACLASAALCVLVTVATTVVHMSRLQSLSQCHYQQRTQTCTCYSALVDGTATEATDEGARYVFNAIPDCDVIHGALYSCLRAMFGLSVVGILVCIFSGMLVYQLFSHEKKKMYWEQLELRCRYLYRRQQTQPAGQPLAHTPMAHHCGRCSCCDDCRDLHTPPPSIPWEFIDSRYWAPGRVGNLYSPSPEDHVAAPRPGGGAAARPGSTAASGSAWSWRRLPWARSSGGGGAVGASSGSSVARADGSLCGLRAQNAPSPDSQYGFGALGQLGPLGRDPSVGPYLLSQVYPTPQPHPRPFAPGPVPGMPMPLTVPMPLGMADDLGPQFYLWGPPPPYMSNPASAANSPARRDPVLPAASTPLTAASARTALRTHLCSPVVTAVPVTSASVEDAGSTSAMDSLSSPEKTVPRKKRKKALASSESPVDAGLDGEGLPPPDSPESPTPSPVTPATAPGPAAGVRKTKKRSDACVMPGGRHAARYSHRTRSSQHSHSSRRPASADSCCPERPCQRATVPDSDDVDTEGYSYPRLKFPPPQAPIASSAAPACDSQAILAAFDNQAFQDAASDCQPCPAGTLSNPGGPVKTLTLGPQGPLVCKKRPSDLSESEVYFGDDSSCCNVSEPHSSLTYDEGRELRELRAFKLVHTHAQQRSMDAALPMRPVSMHGPSASTLSDTAVADPHYRLHPLSVDPAQSGRQRMPLPIPQASLAPDLQYESIADSNVYTYIIGPAGPPARRSCKAGCDSALAPPVSAASRLERPEPSSDDKQNAANVQRESAVTAGAQEPGVCLSEEL